MRTHCGDTGQDCHEDSQGFRMVHLYHPATGGGGDANSKCRLSKRSTSLFSPCHDLL